MPTSMTPTASIMSPKASPASMTSGARAKSQASPAPAAVDEDALREIPEDSPGLDAVGHGIYLRPHQPHELKRVLFKREGRAPYVFKDTGQAHHLPRGYEIDDSPPMPVNEFLNQVILEESWDRFDKRIGLDTGLSVGNSAFSINSIVSQTTQMRTIEEAYYALRSSFIALWSVYLSDKSLCTDEINQFDIPHPFSHTHRAKYNAFFERFGSHYVERVWVGGKALLFFTVLKSSRLTKEEIKLGIQASFGLLNGDSSGDGTVDGGDNSQASARVMAESREKVRKSSLCSVLGRGGDEVKLAALSSLDEACYNAWLSTIRKNPQSIELEVAGLWTLLKDPKKAQALREAYAEESTFSAISAAFAIDQTVYYVRGRKYFSFNIEKAESETPKPLAEKWPFLEAIGFDRIDAAFCGHDLISESGEALRRKLFFFRKDQVIRVDIDKNAIDPGYPKLFTEEFPGVPFERLDVVLDSGRDTLYFFAGNKYVRFNTQTNRVDEGYPDRVSTRWIGVTFDRIDAAIYWGNGKVYFFKEDLHIRYDMVTRRADPGYPKFIIGNYVEDWKFFD
jgi:hypothetical protein